MKRFGNLETRLLKYDLLEHHAGAPIFVTGLARSGSTLLLEILDTHKDTGSHCYGDYPFVAVTYFWKEAMKLFPMPKKKVERAHQDGLLVNASSPEAMDEMIWMMFFDQLHDVSQRNVLGAEVTQPEFEDFFANHMNKVALARGGSRYLSKNNYAFSRLGYLHRVYPEAKFVIPIRRAEEHIYSMLKQHRLLSQAQAQYPRTLDFMRYHGHFEFGLDFRPIHFGDQAQMDQILSLWAEGKHLEAYAHHWNAVHRYLLDVKSNSALAGSCHFVRFDDVCANPKAEIEALGAFCDLSSEDMVARWADQIKVPDYYKIDFTDEERALIKEITGETEAALWI